MNAAAPQGPVRPRWALEDLTVESLQLLWLADELEKTGDVHGILSKYWDITTRNNGFFDQSVMRTLRLCGEPLSTNLAVEIAAMALRVQAFSLQKRKLL